MEGLGPQTGQAGSRLRVRVREIMESESKWKRRPMRGWPMPVRSLMASEAWSVPMRPVTVPRMPASAQEGTVPGGGGVGNMQR